MLPNETVRNGASSKCFDCNKELERQVLYSGGGYYYIGYWSDCYGPHSRESHYYKSRNEAQEALDADKINWR